LIGEFDFREKTYKLAQRPQRRENALEFIKGTPGETTASLVSVCFNNKKVIADYLFFTQVSEEVKLLESHGYSVEECDKRHC
jgi:hypothetical protein